MKLLKFTFVLLSLICLSCATATSISTSPGNGNDFKTIKNSFISNLALKWDSYGICEHRDRSNQYSFLELLITTKELSQLGGIEAEHIVVRQHTDPSGIDLSI